MARAGQLAARYEETYHGCAQCVLLAVQRTLGLESAGVFKAATGLSGGLGCLGHVCGALTGGVIAFGIVVGRTVEDLGTQTRVHWENYAMVRELVDRCTSAFGPDLSCRAIQTQVLGRSFDLWNPLDQAAFRALERTSSGCAYVASSLAQWTVDILLSCSASSEDERGGA